MAFKITRGNYSDVKSSESLLKNLQGLAFGDKGYIGKTVFNRLLKKGLKLITRVRKKYESETPVSTRNTITQSARDH